MVKSFFKNKKNVHLIPRGVDTTEFVKRNPSKELRKQYGLNNNDRIIICVANLVPVKGVEVLIKSFHKIADLKSDWKLFIVGDDKNEYAKSLKELVKKVDLESRVVFTGKQLNVKEYLNISEIFALPTLNEGRREGSPVSLLEAMACELNVLGSNVPGIKDQLEKFPRNLIEAGDGQSWEQGLNVVFSNSVEENRKLGRNFRKHILEHYKIEDEIKKCEKLYLSIINN